VIIPNGNNVEGRLGRAAQTVTNAQGQFTLNGLPHGTYAVAVGESGERGAVHDVATGTHNVIVVVPDATTVRVEVSAFDTDRVAVGIVGSLPAYTGFVLHDFVGTSFTLTDIPRGDHWVLATNGSRVALERVHVEPPLESDAILQARPTALIDGVVIGVPPSVKCFCEWSVEIPGIPDVFISEFTPKADASFAINAPQGLTIHIRCKTAEAHGQLSLRVEANGARRQTITLAPIVN
jgi:hypothetical protein